ncbi:geranylgeranylglycerol-phosphate geranylgeranyltransferase [Staphylothermus hellenicus]|uniref:UbiA prenyltransferase n=1 Tax=Staphylothermus hellenicus (strain DSM 12710 / JCM 10830 / BK20S6-10-b1 / P8) TaxID=591019 RepID=D7D9G3_STAHD|nr:geranylgeranylglycerol-phosphate geranylgeranyltransferase [Staphylothermus hellenicus]ADI32409.1 UbiA prenyltransferase [Staphylothermus hellenicus DSM 12710]
MGWLKELFATTRPINSFMTGIGVVFAYLVFTDYSIDCPLCIIIGFITGYLGAASSMLINDYVDREVDAVNKPWKPIPSGRIDPGTIYYSSISMLIIIPFINIFLGIAPLITALTYSVVGYMYSYLRKYWWSHFIVSISTTGPIIYGYILAGMPINKLVFTILFSTTIFIITTGREVLKATIDIVGDKKYGYVTIPIKYGVETAGKTILSAGILGSLMGILAGILGGAGILYMVLIIIAAALYTVWAYKSFKRINDKTILEKARKNMLYAMMIGLLAFWLSSL